MEKMEWLQNNQYNKENLGEVPGSWLCINDAEVEGVGDENSRLPDFDKLNGLEGGYYSSNGVIAFVDRNRNFYIAPYDQNRVQSLEEAGYESDDRIWVPDMINKGKFVSPIAQERWNNLR